jgi:2-amino-4-hydroxy-6-hydroxymethyldihydropteridine diphosphokinase/dihydropteroate synthase
MRRAYIALGSNRGARAGIIREAVRRLGQSFRLERTASLYESAAAYVEDQPPFLNTVVAVQAGCSPQELLAELKRIEAELGRAPSVRWGPRSIDLDLLLYGDAVVAEEEAGTLGGSLGGGGALLHPVSTPGHGPHALCTRPRPLPASGDP